jgi:acyl carrier protein
MTLITSHKTDHVSRVIQIMVDKFGVDETALSYSVSFADDLHIDSLDIIEFTSEIEKTFEIKIQDEDVERLTTVGAVIDYIEKHTRK